MTTRGHTRAKRGGTGVHLSLDDIQIPIEERAADLIALDEAPENMAKFDPRKCQIVEMRFFGGMTDAEIASALQISTRTIIRDWKTARMWLFRELNNSTVSPETHSDE